MTAQVEQFARERGREIVDDYLEENPAVGVTRKLSRSDAYEIARRALLDDEPKPQDEAHGTR